jgi:hypothetical protein
VETITWPVPAGEWFRMEVKYDASPPSGSRAVEVPPFTGGILHGVTPDQSEDMTAQTFPPMGNVRIGKVDAEATNGWWVDAFAIDDSTWVGPLSLGVSPIHVGIGF